MVACTNTNTKFLSKRGRKQTRFCDNCDKQIWLSKEKSVGAIQLIGEIVVSGSDGYRYDASVRLQYILAK